MQAYTLQRLDRSLVRDQVAEAVRDLLLSGALPPGAPAREVEIASQLGVSRNPVREALVRLENEGLLVSDGPQRGLRVLTPDHALLEELYSLRGLLEGYAAELAAARRTDADLKEMRRTAQLMGPAYERGDVTELARLDMHFHATSVASSGHRLLVDAWSRCKNLFWFATRFAVESMYDIDGLDRAHFKLLRPLEKGDGAKAAEYARHHVAHFFGLYERLHAADVAADRAGTP